MNANNCLYCYRPLEGESTEFHPKCSRNFFGTTIPPTLDLKGEQIKELAEKIVQRSIAVTGVQPKLSLNLEKVGDDTKHTRLTIVGLWGGYILKPATKRFPHLPENEDLTMHLAAHFGIETAEHSLIRLSSGELAYLTRRFDRYKKMRLPLEDFCQISETQTTDKYRGSMEKVGRLLRQYSCRPGLDVLALFELTLFCFLTGNADMHLKNFSILTRPVKKTAQWEPVLSPAYDLLNTHLAIPEDLEDVALTINARKRKLALSDFEALAKNYGLGDKVVENTYRGFEKARNGAQEWIDRCFLPEFLKNEYAKILESNWKRLFG
jgi:serine/threonine-protein kinase HipA